MTTIRCLTFVLALSSPIFAAGCGKPAMVPAYGKVTFRGYPVNNGVIVFTPELKGPLAIGRIASDGNFILHTGDNPGAYPGSYRVTVSSLVPGSSMSESGGRFEFPRTALPDKYREYSQSRVGFTIEANKSNILPVDLTD